MNVSPGVWVTVRKFRLNILLNGTCSNSRMIPCMLFIDFRVGQIELNWFGQFVVWNLRS